MSQLLLEKINHIEMLLVEINSKLDNFMGFEELSEEEKRELDNLREEVKAGEYVTFDEVFGE